jgi:acetyl-CoA acetyltransferase
LSGPNGHAVITGIGQSEVGRSVNRSGMSLTADAILQAVEDAGLTVEDIGGVATYPGTSPDPGFSGAGAVAVIDALGISADWFLGGLETSGQLGAVMSASMAVMSGVVDHVVCFRTVLEASAQSGGGRKKVVAIEPRVGHWSEWNMPYGARVPTAFAIQAQRYMYETGLTRRQLGEVALNARRNAGLNPKAVFRSPMTLDEYLSVRIISTPLCLYDCDVPVDGSTAIVVSRPEAARGLRRPPIKIESFGSSIHGRAAVDQTNCLDLPMHQSARAMWLRTKRTPADVDVAELYDGFSLMTIQWLEALQFCTPSTVGAFVEGGERIGLTGDVPVNTHGGQLSAGRVHGFGFLHEACAQLWGDGGARQVPGSPSVAVAAAGGGVFAGCLLLTRDQ